MSNKHIDNPEAELPEFPVELAQQLVNWVYDVSLNEGFEWPDLEDTEDPDQASAA